MQNIASFLLFFIFTVSAEASISPRTYNALNDIQAAISSAKTPEEYKEAEEDINELLSSLSGNDLGLALGLQILAQLKDTTNKPEAALTALKKAYALKALDAATKGQIGTSLAYMYFSQGQFNNAIVILDGHIKQLKKEPSPTIYALLAISYFSLEKYAEGLPYIEKACENASKPNESWLANAFAANYKLNNIKRAIHYTDQLIVNFPHKADYWNQKTGLHQSLEEFEKAALVSNLSSKQGYLTKEAQLFNLGILMASSGAPYEVAVTLTDAIEAGLLKKTERIERLLMQAWVQSKEMKRARSTLQNIFQSYNENKDGILLANYLMDAELWLDAVNVSNKIIENKNALSDKQLGSLYLMNGVSLYRLGKEEQALIMIGKASGLKDSSSQAKSWMNYIKQMQG